MTEKHYTRREAAQYLTEVRGLPTTKGTLQKKATTGGGPEYSIWGNKAVSTQSQLDTWADAELSAPKRSTSEAS
jgi:hypothetical protein